MIQRVLKRVIPRLAGSGLTFIFALAFFSNTTYASIAAVSFAFGNWFTAATTPAVFAIAQTITHDPTYSLLAAVVYEVFTRIYSTTRRLQGVDR
jgi:hypothetical protein